jgi:hypothetical protein
VCHGTINPTNKQQKFPAFPRALGFTRRWAGARLLGSVDPGTSAWRECLSGDYRGLPQGVPLVHALLQVTLFSERLRQVGGTSLPSVLCGHWSQAVGSLHSCFLEWEAVLLAYQF